MDLAIPLRANRFYLFFTNLYHVWCNNQYLKDGYALKSEANVTITYDGQGGSMIAIAEAEKKDDGWYQCTAVNSVGSATTRARLQVIMPKEITPTPLIPQLQIPHPGRIILPE